jgi:hypothetical protein
MIQRLFGYGRVETKNVPTFKPERSLLFSLSLKTQRLYFINSNPFHSSGFSGNYTGLAVFKNKAICGGNA